MTNEKKQIKGYTSVMGRKLPYCIEFDACYDVVKRSHGWAVAKDGFFVDQYYYNTKFAAASTIPGRRYVEQPSLLK